MNKIVYNGLVFSDDGTGDGKLLDGSFYVENSLAHDELSIDTLKFSVISTSTDLLLPYGTECTYYYNNSLFGKFYLVKASRVTKQEYNFEFQSSIGLLDDTNHYGGIYSGAFASDIIADVIGNTISYTIKPVFEKIKLYGWLPIDTRRANLQQVLFACGGCVKRNDEGDAYITTLDTTTPKVIADNKIFDTGSITYDNNVTTVSITEHGFIKSDLTEKKQLFKGELIGSDFTTPKELSVTNASLVTWDSPCYDITVNGTTLLESDVNYAVVTATASVEIYGKEYLHTESVITKNKQATGVSYVNPKTAAVSEATLVSLANSASTAERIMSYYGNANVMNPSIILEGEKTTDSIQLTNPYGEQSTGFIKSIEGTFGPQITRGDCEIVLNYVPPTVVGSRTLVSITITTPPTQIAYATGDYFNKTGMVVTANYDDGTTAIVNNYQVSPNTPLTLEDTTIIITYREIGVSANATVDITVKNVLRKIEITQPPDMVKYYIDDIFDPTGMIVDAYYSDGSHKAITDYTYQPTRALTADDTTITITYSEDGVTVQAYQDITVGEAPDLVSIAITTPPTKIIYKLNEYFDRTGMVVTATFADGGSRVVSGYTISPSGALTKDDTTITVSYTRNNITKTTTQAITIVYLYSIIVSNPPTYIEYYEGSNFNKAGMVITAIYSNNNTKILSDTDYTVSPTVLEMGITAVTISYTEDGITATTTQTVKVNYYPYDFTKSAVISESGTYNLADLGATHRNFRVIAISGGQGGQGGVDGTSGTSSNDAVATAGSTASSQAGQGGQGGSGGSGGSGGKIAQIDGYVPNLENSITINIGAAGTGSANCAEPAIGSLGGDTTCSFEDTTISSSDGTVSESGYQDLFTQVIYALSGTDGVAGANGGNGGAASSDGNSGTAGSDVNEYTGGSATEARSESGGQYISKYTLKQLSSGSQTFDSSTTYTFYTSYSFNSDTGVCTFSGKKTFLGSNWSSYVNAGSTYYLDSSSTHKGYGLVKVLSSGTYYPGYTATTYIASAQYGAPGFKNIYSGNGGGGASVTANGTAATDTAGGKGADGGTTTFTGTFGSGGNAGNGGGGGGGAGGCYAYCHSKYSSGAWADGQSGGSGGSGGSGTNGATGCVIIYYS